MYKGYSTNHHDLNIDVCKELRKIVKDNLRLLGYDVQKLEEQILSPRLDGDDMIPCKIILHLYNEEAENTESQKRMLTQEMIP
jgi:hypothetical protein